MAKDENKALPLIDVIDNEEVLNDVLTKPMEEEFTNGKGDEKDE